MAPNPSASLELVAVVVNHIHDLSDLDLFDLLLAELQSIGRQALILRVGSAEKAEDFLRRGAAYPIESALVFSDFADARMIRRLFNCETIVMMNGRHDGLSPALAADEAVGIAEAVADAAHKGVRRAGLVTGRASSPIERQRIALYRNALMRRGIELVRMVQGDYSYASGRAAAAAFAGNDHPDAVFCTSDAMAMGVLDVCRADFPEGRPRRFRLYGFDNISLTGFDAYPISSIGYDKPAYIAEMLRFLTAPDAFAAGDAPVTVPTRFVPRLTG